MAHVPFLKDGIFFYLSLASLHFVGQFFCLLNNMTGDVSRKEIRENLENVSCCRWILGKKERQEKLKGYEEGKEPQLQNLENFDTNNKFAMKIIYRKNFFYVEISITNVKMGT